MRLPKLNFCFPGFFSARPYWFWPRKSLGLSVLFYVRFLWFACYITKSSWMVKRLPMPFQWLPKIFIQEEVFALECNGQFYQGMTWKIYWGRWLIFYPEINNEVIP